MAYEFNYKGVPISVVVNSGENFNVDAWAKLSSTFEALDELPETAIQALKGQIDISPIPIKSPDTSMTIGDTIVLGRIDKPTVAHEFGHIWDAVAGDQNAYTQAILSDARRFDNTITPDDLYSDYSRSIYASDKTTGLKEDFADSVSDYLRDRSSFRSQYPGRAAEIERVLDQVSIPQEELAKMIAEQRKLAEQVSQIPRTEAQIKAMIDSVDKYAQKFTMEAGDKTYQAFRKNLAALYEQTNWKTKQWQQQVEELFRGIGETERKQIMDVAAQITGTEIPGRAKSTAQPMFSKNGDILVPQDKGKYRVYHVTSSDNADKILKEGFKIGEDIKTTGGSPAVFFSTTPSDDMGFNILPEGVEGKTVIGTIDTNNLDITRITYDSPNYKQKLNKAVKELGLSRESIAPWLDRKLPDLYDLFDEEAPIDLIIKTIREQGIEPSEVLGDAVLVNFGEAEPELAFLRSPKLEDVKIYPFGEYGMETRGDYGYYWKPLFAEQDFPVFASKLQTVVDDMPNKMSVDQFKNYLKNKGVKAEELKWTFMDDFFEGKTSITKAEAQQWVKGNTLEVQEVWRTDSNPSYSKIRAKIEENDTTWENIVAGIKEMKADGDSDSTIILQLQEAFDFEKQDAQYILENYSQELPPDDLGFGNTSRTRYSQYTQPGGQDYMELEFILPEDYDRPRGRVTGDIDPLKMEYEELASRIDNIREELGRESQEFITMNRRLQELEAQGMATTPVDSPQYRSSHWEEPNVVAHTRFDTRYDDQGRKILYIDEIQSDWHQHGRDYGYKASMESIPESTRQEIRLNLMKAIEENDYFGFDTMNQAIGALETEGYESFARNYEIAPGTEKALQDFTEYRRTVDPGPGAVPDAPFKTNWDEFVQKRLLRYAADNGYDGIAWSTGVQQAERWQQAVTEAIDTIQYNQTSKQLRAYKNGEEVFSQLVEPNKLAEMVGADNARKLLNTEPDTFSVRPVARNPSTELVTELFLSRMPEDLDLTEMTRWMDQQPEFQALRPVDGSQGAPQSYQVVDQNGNAWGWTYPSQEAAQKAIDDLISVEQTVKTVSGTNVTIGGEGMRKFYDQQFRSNMSKLGKRFGLKVDEIPLEFRDLQGMKNIIEYYELDSDSIYEVLYSTAQEEGKLTNKNVAENLAYVLKDEDGAPFPLTDDDLDELIDKYIRNANSVSEEYEVPSELDKETIRDLVKQNDWIQLTGPRKVLSRQQGIWLSPESRAKITQQSFPLFADNTKAPVDDLTAGWSERQINALDNFLKWRNSVIKQYQQIGIPINELEKYVPFIPRRPLKKDEADLLRSAFGTGVREATADNFDTLLTELSKADPNLRARTTKATRPSQVNEMLNRPWLTEDAAVAMNIRGARAIKAQELNSFVDEFVQTYGLKAGDLSQIAGNTVPDGYTAYKLGVDQAGNKVLQQATNVPRTAIEGTDIVFLPQEMANLYNEYHGLMFNQAKKNGLLKVYDELSTLYKKAAYLWNPGHIMRDFQGNVFNNYLMGVVDPTEYADGLKALRRADGVLQTPRGDLPFSEIYEQAQKMGIIDSVIEHEVPLSTKKAEGAYSRIMRQATYATDGWTRMTGFVHNLKAGQDYAQAAATTKKFLFDYFDLTAFEKKVMRRIIPFYTWMRKNIPLQLKSLITDPRIFARLNDIQNAIAGGPIDWEEKPDYIQDMMAIQPMGSDKYFSNTLPWQDLTRIPTGINSRSLSDLLSSVNPLIRAPIESVTNTNWWTGRPLEDYAGEQTDIPVLTTLLRLLGSDTDYTVGARYGGHLLNQIPILTRAGGLLDAATGQETSDSRILSRVSTTLGGPSVYDASSVQSSADWQERQRLVELIRLLQDQGVEVPTVNELNKTSRYSRLKKILGGGGPLPGGIAQAGVTPTTPQPTTQAVPGNIDLNSRPVVNNADGTISTVRSIIIEEDGKYILIPTVILKNGKWQVVSDKEAIDYYHQTGQHLGIFPSVETADVYAEQLHNQQANQYSQGGR